MAKNLLLLHGALGSAKQLDPIKNILGSSYVIYSFDFTGHGGTNIPDKILMPDLVDQLEEFIKKNISDREDLTIFGYSMGGYAALLLASRGSCKIDNIVTLGTKLLWTEEIATKEIKMLNPAIIEDKVPAFAKELAERHAPQDWKLLMNRTAEMMIDLGVKQYLNRETLERISANCKLMLGDRDTMVTIEETLEVFRQIKGASLSMLPLTPHPIEKVNFERLSFEIRY